MVLSTPSLIFEANDTDTGIDQIKPFK